MDVKSQIEKIIRNHKAMPLKNEPIDIIEPNEIVSERTANAKIFDLGNGQKQAKVYSCPIHYKDRAGNFKSIDSAVKRKPLSEPLQECKYEVKAGNYHAHFDKDKPWNYRMEMGDSYVEFEALFDESKNLIIKVETSRVGIKETITLKNKLAPTTLIWKVSKSGNEIITPDPTAMDSEGNNVPITVEWDNDNLIYEIDAKDAVYPIELDPTSVEATGDGYCYGVDYNYIGARDDDPAQGSGTFQFRVGQIKTGGNVYNVFRGFASFAIPDMSAISACSLFLDGNTDESDTEFDIYLLTSTYTAPVSTDDFPDFDGRQTGTTPHNGTILNDAWNSADYSDGWNEIVFNQNGLDAVFAKKANTFKMVAISKYDYDYFHTVTGNERIFFESSETADKEPYLSITYTEPPPEDLNINVYE